MTLEESTLNNYARVDTLRKNIIDGMISSIGLDTSRWRRKLVQSLMWFPAHKFSTLAASFDKNVAQSGICNAMRQLIPRFVKDVEVSGAGSIPADGPLLILSNHPGAFDELVIASNMPRNDLSIVADAFTFLKSLPATSNFLIFKENEINSRISVIRSIIRRLKEGKSLLLFPSGTVDPDPALLPGADAALQSWSRSIEIILKKSSSNKNLSHNR